MSQALLSQKELIIERPELQSNGKRLVSSAVTLAAWGLWFYLWLPLISLLAWAFGVRLFVEHMLIDEMSDYLVSLSWYGLVVLASAALLIAWSLYNWKRFRRLDRRRHRPALAPMEVADHFQVSRESLALARDSRRLLLRLTANGKLARVKAGSAAGSAI